MNVVVQSRASAHEPWPWRSGCTPTSRRLHPAIGFATAAASPLSRFSVVFSTSTISNDGLREDVEDGAIYLRTTGFSKVAAICWNNVWMGWPSLWCGVFPAIDGRRVTASTFRSRIATAASPLLHRLVHS